jgi:YD repeat-containing protein
MVFLRSFFWILASVGLFLGFLTDTAIADQLAYYPGCGGTNNYYSDPAAAAQFCIDWSPHHVTTERTRSYNGRVIGFNTTWGPDFSVGANVVCQKPDGTVYGAGVVNDQYWTCGCPAWQTWSAASNRCVSGPKNLGNSGACDLLHGNPIHIGIGNKFQKESDYSGPGGPELVRYYNSQGVRHTDDSLGLIPERWGVNWRSEYDQRIVVRDYWITFVTVVRPDGQAFDFYTSQSYGQWSSAAADVNFSLMHFSSGPAAWTLRTPDGSVESYASNGKLLSITSRAGVIQTLTYSDGTSGSNGGYVLDASGNPTSGVLPAGRLIRVADSFGRTIAFGYDSAGRVVTLSDPAASVYRYTYDGYSNLQSVTSPPTAEAPSGAYRQYVYSEPTNVPFTDTHYPHKNFLTGIVDESSSRFATFKYNADGRTILSEHAIGANRVSVSYTVGASGDVASSAVVDALGTTRDYTLQMVLGA